MHGYLQHIQLYSGKPTLQSTSYLQEFLQMIFLRIFHRLLPHLINYFYKKKVSSLHLLDCDLHLKYSCAISEVFLYKSQTIYTISFKHFKKMPPIIFLRKHEQKKTIQLFCIYKEIHDLTVVFNFQSSKCWSSSKIILHQNFLLTQNL